MGIVFWGGVFVAIAAFLTRGPSDGRGLPTSRSRAVVPPPSAAPVGDRRREHDALVDGLIIGHVLTRDHHRPRIAELEEQLHLLEARYDDVWAPTGGDEDDGGISDDADLDDGFDDGFDDH